MGPERSINWRSGLSAETLLALKFAREPKQGFWEETFLFLKSLSCPDPGQGRSAKSKFSKCSPTGTLTPVALKLVE